MAQKCIFTALLALTVGVSARPATNAAQKANGTITTESDGSQVWCEPTRWYDILWFFFANFILHALSVRTLPGESPLFSTVFKFCSLLVPYTGVRRGLCLILRASNLAGNDLQAAARANALCMIIRSPEWRPRDGQVIEGCWIEASEEPEKTKKRRRRKKSRERPAASDQNEKTGAPEISVQVTNASNDTRVQSLPGKEVTLKTKDLYAPPTPRYFLDNLTRVLIETHRFHSKAPTVNMVDHVNVKIHGVCQLAPGYALSYIPEDIKIYSHIKQLRSLSISRLLGLDHTPEIRLASTHDVPRILFSIIQTVSGGYSLYKARGSQIERYGYAAFGLTVLPYMMVSMINLIGSLLTSEYETVYLVHSAVMDEMRGRGGLCDGVVGTLERPGHQLYVHNDGETETKAEGKKMQFINSPGEVRCHDITDGSPEMELQVSERNHITPVKEPWVAAGSMKRRWRRRKEASGNQPPLLCVPSHSGFTRLAPLWYQSALNVLTIFLLILALGLPHIIIAILSGWRVGKSTSTQRTFILNWLITGQVQGYSVSYIEGVQGRKKLLKTFLIILFSYGSYCTMGLVAVAQEMLDSGTCKAL
ncbi:MAG: hypothetical protein Q9179_005019 [Wetmoreana sp. 5 TL-2023]